METKAGRALSTLLFASAILSSILPSARPAAVFYPSACNATGDVRCRIAAVAEEEVELLMDSEIHRRFLAGQSPYLTYRGTLDKDRASCQTSSGASYKGNCFGKSGNQGGRPCYYNNYRCD